MYDDTNYSLFNLLGRVEQTNQSKIAYSSADDRLVQSSLWLLKVLAVGSVYVTGIDKIFEAVDCWLCLHPIPSIPMTP